MSIMQSASIPDKKRHSRFGKNYFSIDFNLNDDMTEDQYESLDDSQNNIPVVVGTLEIGKVKIPVTHKELERLRETIAESQHAVEWKYRLGLYRRRGE